MKISFKPFPESQISIELNADKETDVFQAISRLQDVFGEKSCGVCDLSNIKFQTRKAKSQTGKDFLYHEMTCLDCGAKLQYGQHNNNLGTLFPKRTNDKSRGWAVFQPTTNNKSQLPLKPPPPRIITPPPQEEWQPAEFQEEENIPF
jgi:hypothetical protein